MSRGYISSVSLLCRVLEEEDICSMLSITLVSSYNIWIIFAFGIQISMKIPFLFDLGIANV
jgi:hypothetical protein